MRDFWSSAASREALAASSAAATWSVAGVLAPPLLADLGQGVDRVVVLVGAGQRLGVVALDRRPVVLGPVRDAVVAVVRLELVHPALADERYVADDPRRREAGQVAHDAVLQLLGPGHRHPPVLAERDHVAHVEVVRHDLGAIEQREAEVEQRVVVVVDAAHQHALVADVADAGVEHRPGRLARPSA